MSVRAVSVYGASLSLCTRSLCWPHAALQGGAGPVRLQLVHLGWPTVRLRAVTLCSYPEVKDSAQQPRPGLLTTAPFTASADFLKIPASSPPLHNDLPWPPPNQALRQVASLPTHWWFSSFQASGLPQSETTVFFHMARATCNPHRQNGPHHGLLSIAMINTMA